MMETCSLWPVTSSDWAAWVQAIGTIVAIAAAIGIASWQHHADQRRRDEDARVRKEEERAQAEKMVDIAMLYGSSLVTCIGEHWKAVKFQNQDKVREQNKLLHEIQRWYESIDWTTLPAVGLTALLKVRSLSSEVTYKSDEFGSDWGPKNWNHFEHAFSKLRTSIHEAVVVLGCELGRPVSPELPAVDFFAEAQ